MSAAFSSRRFRAMLIKECLQIIRDPSTVLIAFVLPILLLLIFGYALNFDTARTRVGIDMQDQSEAAKSLATTFQNSRWFNVAETGDVTKLKDDLVAGRIRGIIVIPQDFGRTTAQGHGTIQVITDGGMPNNASFIAAYAEGLRATWAAQRAGDHGQRAAPPITIESHFWFNKETNSRFALVPGSIAIVMTMIGCLLTALVIAREWERGTIEAIMATSMGMGEFVATKVVPYFVLGLGAMAVCTVVSMILFAVPLRGSIFGLVFISSAFLCASLGQGLLISAIAKSQFVASQIALLTAFLPSLLLSGFIYEISSAPRWVQWVTVFVPARYVISQLRTVFLVGDDWHLFLQNSAIIMLFAVIFFYWTLSITKRRIA